MDRDYGKCEAYSILHRLREKLHNVSSGKEIKKMIAIMEQALENKDEEK